MKPLLLTFAALTAAGGLASCGQKAETEAAQVPGAPAAEGAVASVGGSAMNGMTTAEAQGAKTAKGAGTVTAVDPAAGTITINHGPIPEVNWPTMTMGFKATPEQVGNVKAGDKIAFNFKLEGGAGEITAIRKR